MKKFSIVKITNKHDIHFDKKGVIIAIKTRSVYPYRVCFGCNKNDYGIIGIYHKYDFEVICNV